VFNWNFGEDATGTYEGRKGVMVYLVCLGRLLNMMRYGMLYHGIRITTSLMQKWECSLRPLVTC
jgi:hypothetical protein